jgi:hypothetical protein
MSMKQSLIPLLVILIFLGSCIPQPATPTEAVQLTATNTSVEVLPPTQTENAGATSTPENTPVPTPGPDDWMNLPVVPAGVSQSMLEVYQRGLARGRDPARFSKFGDCQSVPSLFLGTFDDGTYELGDEYAYLQSTVDYFAGSWSRVGFAVKGGQNVAAVQTLYYTDPQNCELTESPMVCETRVYNPSIVLISFETWWAGKPVSIQEDEKGSYEARLRAVVDYVLSQDVVPILATKADNEEGGNRINAVIARIAFDYQLPLWNFWAATYVLPSHGLADGFHLTTAQNIFDDPVRMQNAWPWRNLTALQTIDAVYRALNTLP